jgi:hypothetical protein
VPCGGTEWFTFWKEADLAGDRWCLKIHWHALSISEMSAGFVHQEEDYTEEDKTPRIVPYQDTILNWPLN